MQQHSGRRLGYGLRRTLAAASKPTLTQWGAFRLFRNYDGAGGRFGDIGLRAASTDPISTSVYASRDERGRLVVIAINKTPSPVTARLVIPAFTAKTITVWTMRDGASIPVSQPGITPNPSQPYSVVMPPMSASAIVLQGDGAPLK